MPDASVQQMPHLITPACQAHWINLILTDALSLIAPDCYAHQINLIVGDYFKVDKGFLKFSKQATELITWLRSKTYVLALIRKMQVENGRSAVSIIRAVLTSWTAHYLAYCRLLEVKLTLQALALQDSMRPTNNKLLTTGDKKAKAKAVTMVKIINNHNFWSVIERMKEHLEPLAIATNIMQAAFCRLDEVLLTFGNLYRAFDHLKEHADCHVRKAVLSLAEEAELSKLADRGTAVSDDGGSVGLDPVAEAILRGF
ncbi:hypothetical protein C8R44DRAFT_882747 [Mycena epipterygia]|nr:hypothetical protein C8R44DRAFT_882747 [Mycena epipterygia]